MANHMADSKRESREVLVDIHGNEWKVIRKDDKGIYGHINGSDGIITEFLPYDQIVEHRIVNDLVGVPVSEALALLHKGEYVIPAKRAKEIGELSVKIDVDVSEALTGLKAVQREAREAAKALRELETYYESEGKRYYVKWLQSDDDECTDIREVCLSDVPTKYLHRELAKREGVEEYVVDPHGALAELNYYVGSEGLTRMIEGPARILVNRD